MQVVQVFMDTKIILQFKKIFLKNQLNHMDKQNLTMKYSLKNILNWEQKLLD